ncbi:MAG: hypothetical protein GQ574_09215 [Crocinitomix sp.]|nr:hypothetical protein [Crocinitomix sp.]
MSRKINKGRLFRNVILIALVIGAAGLYLSNKYVKTKGFDNIGDFVSNYQTNKKLSDGVEAEAIQLLLSDGDYQFLKDKRQKSLDRGIQVNRGDNYVNCKLLYKGDTIKGEMRLKGHMTDHLEGEKWSFRVKTEDEVMGMYRFSLQNPATRNYAYEWIYHELLENEEVIHLKYDFIKLKLNDQDLGIYAIEEHFGQHILRNNDRPPGAILRWNPELYWEHRLDELDGVYIDEGYSNYSASFPEAYDQGVVEKDPKLVETYQKGALLLEQFRRGFKTTSEVFDVEKMARFHAVIDLVGGYHSLDWSDVKFYYNSETGKIEPVGYESFSVRKTVKIAGQRTPEDYATVGFNYHDRLFADPEFFKVYIQSLQRICDEAYFKTFTDKIEEELNNKRGVLAAEFAYIKFSFQPYYDNIELIRKNLELPKPFHAFLEASTDSTVTITVSPVSDYPIEILSLVVNEKRTYNLDSAFVLPPKARNTYAHYFKVEFKHDGKKLKNLKVGAKIPGGDTFFEIPVTDLPMSTGYEMQEINPLDSRMDSILTWVNDSIAFLSDSHTLLSGIVEIPLNKTLIVNAGQSIDFENEGRFIVKGELKFLGSDLNEVMVSASALVQDRPCLTFLGGSLVAVHTQFSNIQNNLIEMENGNLSFQKCVIADSERNLIQAQKSTLTFVNCSSGTMSSLGIFNQCIVKIKSFTAKVGRTFIEASGSDIEMHQSKISGYDFVSDLDFSSDFSSWGSVFENNEMISGLNNVSTFKTYGSTIVSGSAGVYIYDTERPDGAESSYLFYKTPTDKLTNEVLRSNG